MTKPDSPEVLDANLDYLRLGTIRSRYRDRVKEAVKNGQTHLEFLGNLVDEETRTKKDRALRSRLAAARMPAIKTLDGWDWKWNAQNIRREQILPLLDLEILKEKDKRNLLLMGRQGLGKTRIALAIAHAACCRGVSTLFTTAADMLNRLYAATADRSLEKALRVYTRPTLLILDEVGYLPFSKEAGDLFFQVVAKRYEQGSIVLTCNRAFKDWSEIFADSVVAAAIIERLVHHSQIVVLKGRSYRLKDKESVTIDATND
jgi:DNA replication protein DnaC